MLKSARLWVVSTILFGFLAALFVLAWRSGLFGAPESNWESIQPVLQAVLAHYVPAISVLATEIVLRADKLKEINYQLTLESKLMLTCCVFVYAIIPLGLLILVPNWPIFVDINLIFSPIGQIVCLAFITRMMLRPE
jgi:hypothetical protein